ncbi:MAG TPA: hypothetical protein VHP37_22745 [Burkholderiales bacterium]|nr:hypothetical protein [Burkholderiales bacterium]
MQRIITPSGPTLRRASCSSTRNCRRSRRGSAEGDQADQRLGRIPVVAMTSSREERDLAMTCELGVNGDVVKPLDFNTFAEITRHGCHCRLAIDRSCRAGG